MNASAFVHEIHDWTDQRPAYNVASDGSAMQKLTQSEDASTLNIGKMAFPSAHHFTPGRKRLG